MGRMPRIEIYGETSPWQPYGTPNSREFTKKWTKRRAILLYLVIYYGEIWKATKSITQDFQPWHKKETMRFVESIWDQKQMINLLKSLSLHEDKRRLIRPPLFFIYLFIYLKFAHSYIKKIIKYSKYNIKLQGLEVH